MKLEDVSKRQLRKKGFLSSAVIINKDMILLFTVDKDVILDNHKHLHTQLGYCFNGDFNFDVEGEHYFVIKGHSYLLKGNVFHSAVATTDYYSMDIKRILNENEPSDKLTQNVFQCVLVNESYILCKAQIGDSIVQKVSFTKNNDQVHIELDIKRKNYIVVSKSCVLKVDGQEKQLEPMGIYLFETDKEMTYFSTACCDVEIIFITY